MGAVETPDVSEIEYYYNFDSIFATPEQEEMYVSPYSKFANGGTVNSNNLSLDDLIQLLEG